MAAKNSENMVIRIGSADGDHISIGVLGRMHPKTSDYWDGNWLISPIEILSGGFRADVGAGLRTEELVRFREALEELDATLKGEAVLDSMEGWLRLQVAVDSRGRLRVVGEAVDQPGNGNRLTFRIDGLDQSHLGAVVSALVDVEARFPVLGQPEL